MTELTVDQRYPEFDVDSAPTPQPSTPLRRRTALADQTLDRSRSDRPDRMAPSPRLAMQTAASKLRLLAITIVLALVQLALEPCTAAASQPVNPANPLRVSFPLVGASFDLRRLRDPAMNLAPGERRGFYNILDTSFVTGVASANYSYIFNVSVRAAKIAAASEPQRDWPAGLSCSRLTLPTSHRFLICSCAVPRLRVRLLVLPQRRRGPVSVPLPVRLAFRFARVAGAAALLDLAVVEGDRLRARGQHGRRRRLEPAGRARPGKGNHAHLPRRAGVPLHKDEPHVHVSPLGLARARAWERWRRVAEGGRERRAQQPHLTRPHVRNRDRLAVALNFTSLSPCAPCCPFFCVFPRLPAASISSAPTRRPTLRWRAW